MTQGRAVRPWLQGTTEPLSAMYDVALLDLDGVVYLGPDPIDGVPEVLAKVRGTGMRLAFVTNNASRAPAAVAEHLAALGVPARVEDVVTSSQAAATLVVERLGAGASVLVTGSPALRQTVEEAGLRPVASADDRPDAVVQGFWSQLCYADLAEAALAVRAGALWVATNVDSTLPSPRGLLPGNGSLTGVVRAVTGKVPVVAGKPALPLHAEGVRRTSARRPLVVGDRLDTDIEGANVAETPSLLVLTGVTTPTDLLTAIPTHRPSYLASDLAALLEPAPDVDVADRLVRCGAATARSHDGYGDGIEVDGGPAIDALRALLGLVWSIRDSGADCSGAREALERLGMG